MPPSRALLTALLVSIPAALLRPAADAVGAEPWHFDWGGSCRVPVTERIEREGRGATSTFVLELRPAGGGFELRFDDFRMRAIEGLDPADPRSQEVLEKSGRRAAALMPVLAVDARGHYAGITHFDELVDGVVAMQAADPESARRTREALASPRMRVQLEQKTGDYWNSWVGSWLELGLAPGQARQGTSQLSVPGGSLPLETKLEHRGPPPHAPNRAQLFLSSQTTDADMKDMLAAVVAELGPEHAARMQDLGLRYERHAEVEADVEPEGLRPHHVRVQTTTRVSGGGETLERRDVRDDTFQWDHAEGCGR